MCLICVSHSVVSASVLKETQALFRSGYGWRGPEGSSAVGLPQAEGKGGGEISGLRLTQEIF